MHAFDVNAEVGKNSKCKAECLGGYLPEVSCKACGTDWFMSDVWYPTIGLNDQSERKLYSDERTVSVKELTRLREGLVPKNRAKRMPPGAGIGPIQAQLSPYATDFVWSAFRLLAAKPAMRKLEEHGIIIPHGSALAYVGRVRSEAYVALELEPYPLCSSKTEEILGVVRCEVCSGVRRPKGFDHELTRSLVYEYVEAKAPKDHGLILEDVEDFILASDAFMRIYRKNKMTGLEFSNVGVWV
jgi:hypothetical protein